MRRRKLLPDGTLGPFEDVFGELAPEEKIDSLGQQLAQEKVKSVQKDLLINNLGQQVASLKIDLLQLKGGGQ